MQDHSHMQVDACWDEKLQVVEGGKAKTSLKLVLWGLGKQKKCLLSPFLCQF